MNTAHEPVAHSEPRLLVLLSAIGLAAVAQYAHTYLHADAAALLLFASALLLWLTNAAQRPDAAVAQPVVDSPLSEPRSRPIAKPFAFGALALALVTLATSRDNSFDWENVSAWTLSLAAWVYAFWTPERSWEEWRGAVAYRYHAVVGAFRGGVHVPARVLTLALVLLATWFFYFYNLDGVPGEMDSDHAEKVLDVNDVVTSGLRPIFFERNTGREPLEFYLIAWLVDVGRHPIDHMALKLVTATMGLLVVPATYLMVRELLDERIALVAAVLVGISKWPVTIARMGLRFPFTPVFVAPTIYFLLRALKYRRRNDALMTGLFLGAGLYGYNAFRMVPVLVAAFALLWLILQDRPGRRQIQRLAGMLTLVLVTALLVFMPLFGFSLAHPENFWYRVLTRLAAQEQALPGNPAQILVSNLVNAGLMFNWTGDQAWPNNIPGDPALDFISGGLFVLGIALAAFRTAVRREKEWLLILAGIAIMLMPTALSLAFPNENPSNARAGGAVPFVYTIVALPIVHAAERVRQLVTARAGLTVASAMVALIGMLNFNWYFSDFDLSYRQQSWNSSEIASAIKGFGMSVGDVTHAYLMLYPHWVDTRNVAINMGKIGWEQTLPGLDAVKAQTNDGANKLYVLHPNDKVNLTGLQDIYPNGQLRVYHARTPGHDFELFYVPGVIAPMTPLGYH